MRSAGGAWGEVGEKETTEPVVFMDIDVTVTHGSPACLGPVYEEEKAQRVHFEPMEF
jgi:hypothetical protein